MYSCFHKSMCIFKYTGHECKVLHVFKFAYFIQINRKNIQLTQFHTFCLSYLSTYLNKIN